MSGARVLGNALRRAGRVRVRGEDAGGSLNTCLARPQSLVETTRPSHLRALHTTTPTRSWRTSPAQPPTHTHNPKDTLSEQLRGVMRRLAHPVVVCTSTDREGRPRGMTMSSLVSLSMDPVPLVTFNVRTPSRTLAAIEDLGGRFNVHVLAEGAEGARVAERFTRGNNDEEGNVFAGVEVVEEDGEAPVLEGDGVLFVLKCRALGEGVVRVRDHVVVVGEVEVVVKGGGEGFGLVYADRRYRALGDVLAKEQGT